MVSATCLFIPQSASAQDSRRLAVTGGYSLVRDNDIDEILTGWVASATGHIASSFGTTAEAGGKTKTLPVLGTTLKYRSLSFMAGPHVSVRPVDRVTLLARCSRWCSRFRGDIGSDSLENGLRASAWRRRRFLDQPHDRDQGGRRLSPHHRGRFARDSVARPRRYGDKWRQLVPM